MGVRPTPFGLVYRAPTFKIPMMGKLYRLLLLLIIFLPKCVDAQGTMLFTWHGDSNYFTANFQVFLSEMLPGTNFSSQLFHDSLTVTDPLGATYHGGDANSAASGSYIPWNLSGQMNDYQRNTEAILVGGSQVGNPYAYPGVIWEQPMSSSDFLWFETGHWTFAQAPEPGALSLFTLGAGIGLLNRKRRLCSREP